jgi:thiol-disulfide isomerase/thioredoxin
MARGAGALRAALAAAGLALAQAAHAAPAIPPVAPMAVDAGRLVLTRPDGSETDLAALLGGRPAILHFWATWCGPCREELPALAAYAVDLATTGGGGLVVVAVEPSPPEKIAAFLEGIGLDGFATLRDPGGRSGGAFGLFGMPSTVLVDGAGRVVARRAGPLDWHDPDVRAELAAHLGR